MGEMKYHYVYRIDRHSIGEWYVGIRSCACWPEGDVKYWGSGTRIRRIPHNELVKTILVIMETRKEAARIEGLLVGSKQLEDSLCLNLVEGGEIGSVGLKFSAESKAKLSAQRMGNTNRLGKKSSEETKAKHRIAMKGNQHLLGHKHSVESRLRMSNAGMGRICTNETRQKLSKALRGKKRSDKQNVQHGKIMKAWWTSPSGLVAKEKLRERNRMRAR